MKLTLVLCSLFLTIHSLMASTPFTERELEIIYNGIESEPFRILQTTDYVDSIVLRMNSSDIEFADSIIESDAFQYFLNRLHVTLKESGGVGIAAPQVGVLKNIFLFQRIDKPDQDVQVAINPIIENYPFEKVVFERDACLSIPNLSGNSLRYPWIDVKYMDEKGAIQHERLNGYSRSDDFTAVIFQHEYDHLHGILFIDKILPPVIDSTDMNHRIALDFNKSRDDIIDWVEENQHFKPTDDQIMDWEESGVLEFRIINGEKKYFRNAAPNIFRLDSSVRSLAKSLVLSAESGAKKTLDSHLNDLTPSGIKGKYSLPKVKTKVKYNLTVPLSEIEEGELVKAWLPYPRKDVGRQTEITFEGASHLDHIISIDRTDHTSIYMSQVAKKNEPINFTVEFSFVSQGEWFDLNEIVIEPYNKESDLYKKYTSQKKPHIHFSERIKNITDSVTLGADSPVEILQTAYRYIAKDIPWASAIEYSTIPDIPEYVLENKKGDCGQVALLLINMLRYKGIPARWQSGWMTHPGAVNLHDWVEVYFEGTGWIPVDISFGRGEPLDNDLGRDFFMSGIDSYRLYINNDFSDSFFPHKSFPRSETVDFQRGEVETETENLYFDRWRYNMEVVSQEIINE